MAWWRVLVPGTCTLRELYNLIQVAMGWEGIHLYQSSLLSQCYGLCVNWHEIGSSAAPVHPRLRRPAPRLRVSPYSIPIHKVE